MSCILFAVAPLVMWMKGVEALCCGISRSVYRRPSERIEALERGDEPPIAGTGNVGATNGGD